MSFADIEQTILTAWNTDWDKASIPYTVDNFDKAVGAARKVANLEQFVRVSVLPASGRQAEIATNPFKRIEGVVQVSWFGKANIGIRQGYEALDTAKAVFELKTINNITFRAGSVVNVGESDGYYNLALSVPFFTFTKT